MKKAMVVGATGLVGSHLLKQLLEDVRFGEVAVFVRRTTGIDHPKLQEHLVDFSKPTDWQHLVKGDVLYMALGTTRAKAGSKKAQYAVDHGFQFQFAAAAARNMVPVLVLVSSAGARVNSSWFYMRMKGQLEQDVSGLKFRRTVIIRPGALTGPRPENRPGEKAGVAVVRLLNRMGLLNKMRPIHGNTVAKAMVNATFREETGITVIEPQKVFKLAGEK
jgi:uncharacterized protein YbjT (DUF2867 family)